MRTLESKISAWIISAIFPPMPKKEPRENILTDYLIIRYNHIWKLRELTRAEICRKVRSGEPYNLYKLRQADHLLRQVTKQINDRPFYNDFKHLNMN